MRRAYTLIMVAALVAILLCCTSGASFQISNEWGARHSSNSGAISGPSKQAESKAAKPTTKATPSSATSTSGASGESGKEKNSDYVLPDSDSVVYSTSELEKLSNDDLFYARNELFARHGAKFEDKTLSEYFGAKGWYKKIEPKTDEYGSEILNLVEALNAATLRRIELERGSSHVNTLDPNRTGMYKSYLEKAEEYRSSYGTCTEIERDRHNGLTGLCLTQLIDFDGDGWEELLLVYHDKSRAPQGDFFNPDSYRAEVWSYRDGALSQIEQMGVRSTQATSSFLLLSKADKGYVICRDDSPKSGLVYYYNLSDSLYPSAGDGYWRSMSDVSFNFKQVQTITEETLANLRGTDGTTLEHDKLHDNALQFLVGNVALIKGDEKELAQPRLWAALKLDDPIVYTSKDYGEVELDSIQLDSVVTEGGGRSQWEPYEGQHVVLIGNLKGQDWNLWHLTPCVLEGASVLGSGAGHRNDRRDEVAVAFATAIRTNYRIENGEHVQYRPDYRQYVSPTSELYEWKDGNDEGEEILVVGNPCRVENVEVTDVVGDVYILDVTVCVPEGSLENEVLHQRKLAVVFNDRDLVEHAYMMN